MINIDYRNNIVIHDLLHDKTAIIPIPKSVVEQKLFKIPRRPLYKANRNDPCPCGSGKKFKKCCIDKYI